MPIIQVVIFRGSGGLRNPSNPLHNEPALVRAGHVGVIGVIENTIIGFHPTPEAAEALGGAAPLIAALSNHQPGCLQDDTAVFRRAHELVQTTHGRTTVYTYGVEISDETLADIRTWYNDKRQAPYNFPNLDGTFVKATARCSGRSGSISHSPRSPG